MCRALLDARNRKRNKSDDLKDLHMSERQAITSKHKGAGLITELPASVVCPSLPMT